MTSTTTLTVLPLPEDWMPPADWERREIPSEPNREPGYEGGVTYVLDVTKRELVAVPVADYTSESDLGEYLSWEHVRKGVVPARMKLGVLALRFHPEFANGKSVNGILEEVLPLAQDVVDTLVPVAGTSTFDWSAAADMATARIRHVIERTPYRGTEHDFPFRYGAYRLEAKTFFTACHDLVQPQWAELGDDRLDGVLSDLHRVCHEVSQLPENFNRLVGLTTTGPLPDHAHGPTTEFHLVGVRAWLYDLRKARAGDMTPVDAARWDGIAAYAVRVRDDSTSADLDRIAQQVTAAAAEQGVKLLGARSWAWSVCRQRREDIRTELQQIGAQITGWENDLKPAKRQRRALVTRVLSWGQQGDTNSSIGTLASMSHTAVAAIRETLEREDEETE